MNESIQPANFWRMFIALHLPAEVKEQVGLVQSALRQSTPRADLRWSLIDQMHLTLIFLGNVAVPLVAELTEKTTKVVSNFVPIQLSAGHVGFFPEEGAPRVIWVGVEDPSSQLMRLHNELAVAVHSFVEKKEDRPFTAHLTLGRVNRVSAGESQALRDVAQQFSGKTLGAWTATAIEIMRSELSSRGARHDCVAELPLEGGQTA